MERKKDKQGRIAITVQFKSDQASIDIINKMEAARKAGTIYEISRQQYVIQAIAEKIQRDLKDQKEQAKSN